MSVSYELTELPDGRVKTPRGMRTVPDNHTGWARGGAVARQGLHREADIAGSRGERDVVGMVGQADEDMQARGNTVDGAPGEVAVDRIHSCVTALPMA